MSRLWESLLPRAGWSILIMICCGFFYIIAGFLFERTNPDYLVILAVIQGVWLGVWCQDLHQFANSHVIPRFASRILGVMLTYVVGNGVILVVIGLANPSLLAIIGLLLAIIVAAIALILWVRQAWVAVALPYGIWLLSFSVADSSRASLAEWLNSSFVYPVAVMALFVGIGTVYVLLSKPVGNEGASIRQNFSSALEIKNRSAVGFYAVDWIGHIKVALILSVGTLAYLQFYDGAVTLVHLFWMMMIIFNPAQNLGRSIVNAPRAWLVGVADTRAALSMALLARLLGVAGVLVGAALGTALIADLLSLEMPQNFVVSVFAAFAGAALSLGLICSFSSDLGVLKPTAGRSLLVAAIVFPAYLLTLVSFELSLILLAVFAGSALFFLYRGHQRITNLDFTTF